MIRDHKQAVLTRLREDSVLTDSTYEGVVEDRPARYCTIYVNSGRRTAERVTGGQTTATFTFTIHSVGTAPDQAQLVAERVFNQLLDWTPDVPGYRCRRIIHAASYPTQRDPDGLPPVYFAVDEFDLTTETLNKENSHGS